MTKSFSDMNVLKKEIMGMKLETIKNDMIIDLCKKWVSQDEEDQIIERNNEDSNVNWDSIEKFFSDLLEIKRVKQRLQLLKFKLEFNEKISDILNPIQMLNSACDQIIEGKKIRKIFE